MRHEPSVALFADSAAISPSGFPLPYPFESLSMVFWTE